MSQLLGLIGFAQPVLLWTLLALPAIWWLLRFTPPRPRRIAFPPLRLLLGLQTKEETPATSPWWLTAIRITLAGLLILALAAPVLRPRPLDAIGSGPTLVIVDNGWASGADWELRRDVLREELEDARLSGTPVIMAPTLTAGPAADTAALEPGRALERIESIQPLPYAPERLKLLEQLRQQADELAGARVIWLSDGLDHGDAQAFLSGLADLTGGQPTLYLPNLTAGPLALGVPIQDAAGLEIPVKRAASGAPLAGAVRALSLNGRSLAQTTFQIGADDIEGHVRIELPLELRNQTARLQIADVQSAGAVRLLDDRWRRKRVGLVTGESRDITQPLLSPLYYVERAIAPFAELNRQQAPTMAESVSQMLTAKVGMIIMTDVGQLGELTREELAEWIDRGGVLARFAGPRLAASADELVPVGLRQGGRILGGTLSWEEAQPLGAFDADTPFAGLKVAGDVKIERQVLAEPDITLAEKTWAQLADGTPLVTAERRGKGWIILFHVTANTSWSNLPLSGLFVDMLQRLLDLAPAAGIDTASSTQLERQATTQGEALPPLSSLDGRGDLGAPPATAQPLPVAIADTARPSASYPPGLYGQTDSFRSINVINRDDTLAPIVQGQTPFLLRPFERPKPVPLKPWLLAAAFVLLIADTLAVLFMSGLQLPPGKRRATAAAAVVLLAATLTLPVPRALAQDTAADEFAIRASTGTRLAYVVSGNPSLDETTEAGLRGLSIVLAERTAMEPDDPMGVDVARDELSFFPLLYWAIDPGMTDLPPQTLARVDAYMKRGGTILFDTRDQSSGAASVSGSGGPGMQALRKLLAEVDIPPLEPVPADHVLTKAFYLLQSFPGRFDGGELWVEATQRSSDDEPRPAHNSDGVSSILITSNDFAGAWAVDERRMPLLPVGPGEERQREMAYRVGINVVMYALTGNYKADQVHVPALLERLGQ